MRDSTALKVRRTLAELKSLLQAPAEKENLAFSLWPSGLSRGGITAIYGCGKTEFVAQFLFEHPDLQVAWIEEQLSIFPFGFLQRQIHLHRILFVESKTQTEWTVLQILKSQAFPVVVLYSESCDDKALRRFQLAAEKAQTCFLWLTLKSPSGWMVQRILHVQRSKDKLFARRTDLAAK